MDHDYWNGEAGQKWADAHEFMDRILVPFGEAVIEAAQLPERGTVVDVGCGCGGTTVMASRRRPDLTVIGVDVSGPMLEVARRRSADRDCIRFDQQDAAHATPTPAPVDRIISRFGVMFFADPPAAFANLRRWLAPGGRLAAAVWGPLADNRWLSDLLQLVGRHVEMPPMDPDAPGPFSLADPRKVETLLQGAGFASVEQTPLDLPMRIPGSVEDAVEFCMQRGPVAKAIEELAPELRAAITDDIRAMVSDQHDGDGTPLAASARLVVAGT